MKILQKLSYLLLIGLFTQCNSQTKKVTPMETPSATIKEQLAHFNKQKHQLEFREEKLYYNSEHIKLDQGMAYYEDVFGKDYILGDSYGDKIKFNNIPITINKGADDIIDNIRLELYYYDQNMLVHKSDNEKWGFPPKILDTDYILIDGVPLNKDTDIEVFNEMLLDKNKRPFKQKFKGAGAVERDYLSMDSPLENIYISFGSLTNLNYIMYSDGSTTSD